MQKRIIQEITNLNHPRIKSIDIGYGKYNFSWIQVEIEQFKLETSNNLETLNNSNEKQLIILSSLIDNSVINIIFNQAYCKYIFVDYSSYSTAKSFQIDDKSFLGLIAKIVCVFANHPKYWDLTDEIYKTENYNANSTNADNRLSSENLTAYKANIALFDKTNAVIILKKLKFGGYMITKGKILLTQYEKNFTLDFEKIKLENICSIDFCF